MSDTISNLIAANLLASLRAISVASGYYYDMGTDSVLDISKDLEQDGAGNLRVALYHSGFENRQQGDQAAYGQVQKTVRYHIDGAVAVQSSFHMETTRALADLERCVTKDISQGGLALNTFVSGGEVYGLSTSGFGHFTITFEVLLRHAANDPSLEYQTTYN